MRFLTSTIVLHLLSLSACSGGDVFNNDQKQEKPSGEETEKNQGDQQADDPVMVGGAYLACVSSSANEVDCALNNAQTGDKLSLAPYSLTWASEGSPANQQSGTDADSYHQKFSFQSTDFAQSSVSLSVNKDGQNFQYAKSMSQLDTNIRASQQMGLAPHSVDFMHRFKGTINNSSSSDCKNLSFEDCLAKLFSDKLLKGLNGGDKICNSGNINHLGIQKSFNNVLVANPTSVKLKFPLIDANSCVEKSAPGLDGIFESGGCTIVPIRYASQGLIYHVARTQGIQDLNRIKLLARQKLCP